MGYVKTISYADYVELYQYEKDIRPTQKRSKQVRTNDRGSDIHADGTNSLRSPEQRAQKRADNARRATMVFRRLVAANLGQQEIPLLVSLTYSENVTDLGRAHKDFNAFARNIRIKLSKDVRYIAVPEFQKRGAVHFHALFWGLDSQLLASTERRTRFFSTLWGKGFVDLVCTDGSPKLSTYLSKYMSKTFIDDRLHNKKAYIASRNVLRPVIEKSPMLAPLFLGEPLEDIPDLSTADLITEKSYDTLYLGKGRYRLYKLKTT